MENSTIFGFLGVLLLVSVLGTFISYNAGNQEVEVSVNFDEVNAKLDVLDDKLTALESQPAPVVGEEGVVVPSGDYIRNQAEYEDDLAEAEALRLAEESVNLDDRDFLKALFRSLNLYYNDTVEGDYEGCLISNTCPVEDKDDITEIRYETDADADGDVDFDRFRVWFFIDGDEDETEKAKLENFEVLVEDLEFDDDFEDAEVNEDYMDDLLVLKVYS